MGKDERDSKEHEGKLVMLNFTLLTDEKVRLEFAMNQVARELPPFCVVFSPHDAPSIGCGGGSFCFHASRVWASASLGLVVGVFHLHRLAASFSLLQWLTNSASRPSGQKGTCAFVFLLSLEMMDEVAHELPPFRAVFSPHDAPSIIIDVGGFYFNSRLIPVCLPWVWCNRGGCIVI
ncbi:hypothetical protein K438DRAFT_1952846 [Mycena galopus ATCC 62051]|nr:hypothetical protein K438DRAFT_1952846 [Mycena galopus ATCC 62051]